MEHWSPETSDKARTETVDAPSDAWVLWLSRPPEHPAPTPPLPPPSISGIAVVAGVTAFWAGAIALAWHLLAA